MWTRNPEELALLFSCRKCPEIISLQENFQQTKDLKTYKSLQHSTDLHTVAWIQII